MLFREQAVRAEKGQMLPLWLKCGFSIFAATVVVSDILYSDPLSYLWFCQIGNFVIAIALWIESRLLLSCQAISLLLVQVLYTIDLCCRLVFGFHPFGGTQYVFDAEHYRLITRLLALYHVAVPILLMWVIRRLGYDRRAFRVQVAFAWVWLLICFFFTPPERDVNWVFGPGDRPQHTIPPWLYLVLVMTALPVVAYWPTHLMLCAWDRRKGAAGSSLDSFSTGHQ